MKYLKSLFVSLLLLVSSAYVNASTIKWVLPTTWNDGSTLVPTDIVNINVYCGVSTANYQDFRTIAGTSTSITFELPIGDNFCAVTTVAKMSTGELRESDYSNEWVKTPTVLRPSSMSSVIDGTVVVVPPRCAPGATCITPPKAGGGTARPGG